MTKASLQRGLLDHALALVGCVFATYSLGISVAKPILAYTLSGLCVFSVLVGSLLSRALAKSKILQYDSWIAAALGLTSVFFTLKLNQILPEDGFPIELIAGAALSLLVIFTGFAAWRDGTLLFLSLPCIAMFGLVGTFDVYRPATALFFLFLISVAVLYARVYLRSMSERVERLGADTDLLRRDAWKWVAGPEWAFVSAGAIVVISLIAGPIIQVGLSGVSGQVRVNLPQQRNPFVPAVNQVAPVDVRVGNGPVNLSDSIEFKVKMDRGRYLRTRSYAVYRSPGWIVPFDTLNPDFDLSINSGPVSEATDGTYNLIPGDSSPFEPFDRPKDIPITFKPNRFIDAYLPSPGPVVRVAGDPQAFVRVRYDGVAYKMQLQFGDSVTYVCQVDGQPIEEGDPRATHSTQLPPVIRSMGRVLAEATDAPSKICEFAANAITGIKDPYQKALALKHAIARAATYNTQVPPCPPNKDPIEWFLFDKKEGYCDSFASAMVLAARSVGLPARYTVGYAIDESQLDPDDGYYTVRNKDSHAWAEVYFTGHGWVPFDPTDEATSSDPKARNKDDDLAFFDKPIVRAVIIAFATICMAVPILIWAWFLTSARAAAQSGNPFMVKLVWVQNDFQKSIESASKHPRRFSQTIRSFVNGNLAVLGPSGGSAVTIADELEKLMFSGVTLDSVIVKDMQAKVRAFKLALREAKRFDA